MSLKRVPFYANHEDGMHCMLAVYRSIFDYFLHRKMSWEELEAFTGYEPGRAAWTLKSLTQFAAMDFDIQMIDPFDYRRYAIEGEAYLQTIYSDAEINWYLKHSNILDIKPHIPAFLKSVNYDCRSATLSDIDKMLAEGRLIFVTLNSRILNGLDGFASHAILILTKEGNEYIAHDSGGLSTHPQPNRRIPQDLLWKAMGGSGDQNTSEVTGFKLKPRRNLRLDHYVIGQFPLLSRAYAVRLVEDGKVLVNGQLSKPGYKVRERDTITIDYNASDAEDIPEINLPIIYEDDDCIVIDKPVGVLTHSKGGFTPEATVASFLRSRLQTAASLNAGLTTGAYAVRAGIVHRLDRATSGIIICAKTPEALAWLQRQFHDRLAKKTYVAIVSGALTPPAAIIDMPIERNPKAPATFRVGANGKSAVTAYKSVKATDAYSLIELKPVTGRTHQLRVHLAEQKHPIVGDRLYNGEPADRLFLHAASLELTLIGGENKIFVAGLPPEFDEKLRSE